MKTSLTELRISPPSQSGLKPKPRFDCPQSRLLISSKVLLVSYLLWFTQDKYQILCGNFSKIDYSKPGILYLVRHGLYEDFPLCKVYFPLKHNYKFEISVSASEHHVNERVVLGQQDKLSPIVIGLFKANVQGNIKGSLKFCGLGQNIQYQLVPVFLISKMEIKGILCRFMAKIVYTQGIICVNYLAKSMAQSK